MNKVIKDTEVYKMYDDAVQEEKASYHFSRFYGLSEKLLHLQIQK